MAEWLAGMAAFLVCSLAAGLLRVARGPTAADRLLAVQLLGTTGVAILLILAELAEQGQALRDVALLFALLAVVAVAAFVHRRSAARGDES